MERVGTRMVGGRKLGFGAVFEILISGLGFELKRLMGPSEGEGVRE